MVPSRLAWDCKPQDMGFSQVDSLRYETSLKLCLLGRVERPQLDTQALSIVIPPVEQGQPGKSMRSPVTIAFKHFSG